MQSRHPEEVVDEENAIYHKSFYKHFKTYSKQLNKRYKTKQVGTKLSRFHLTSRPDHSLLLRLVNAACAISALFNRSFAANTLVAASPNAVAVDTAVVALSFSVFSASMEARE